MVHTEGENNRIEIWKDYKDYEGLYQASNLGRMRSLDRWVKSKSGSVRFYKGRILKPYTDKDGYLLVGLWKNNKHKTYKVHRLVAETFLPNPDNLPQVNHKDENPLNNNVNNLEWCNSKYNCNFGTRIERISKRRSKTVLQYDLEGNFIKEWQSTRECGRNGYDQGNVAACCRGELKKYKDFIWKYK